MPETRSQKNMSAEGTDTVPHEQPLWFQQVRDDLSAIKTLQSAVKTVQNKLDDISSSINFAVKTAEEANEKVEKIEGIVVNLKTENQVLKSEVNDLQNKLVNLEGHSRRSNLVFDGIEEVENENWEISEQKLCAILIKHNLIRQNIEFAMGA